MTDRSTTQNQKEPIEMPASTAWPVILAFGIALCFASLVTSVGVGLAGLILVCCGVGGWAKQVLPHEHHELVPVRERTFVPLSLRTHVAHLQAKEIHGAYLPVESYPVISGLREGVAGGIIMIFPPSSSAISRNTVSGMP